jgi:predicted MFS family arabinose efflux permease
MSNKVFNKRNFFCACIFYPIFMFLFFVFISPLINGEPFDFSVKNILIILIMCGIGTTIYGLLLNEYEKNRRKNKEEKSENQKS